MTNPNLKELVTPQWVKAQFRALDIKVLDMAAEIVVDKTQISAWSTGNRPMTPAVKAMFYYYFKAKQERKPKYNEYDGLSLSDYSIIAEEMAMRMRLLSTSLHPNKVSIAIDAARQIMTVVKNDLDAEIAETIDSIIKELHKH